ncbi:uncharacterized protein LOC119098239 [Pollicipes pollicipes]|uniref:uncharacterized protein LOC119098239 n=1 Tax=Pollicipes pollicipes TaxID=41117 RepID=UPI001884D9F2|nr:uncharacterized protein LOC119098239 [Pollicipes pollicipes]
MAPPSGPLTLTLAGGSAIVSRGVGSGPLAGRATGSVSVSFAEAMAVPPEFSLVGPSVVCSAADSRATYRALTLEGLGRALTYTWNVTLEADTTLTQRTTLEVWQGINEVMERDATYGTGAVSVYTINTSPLIADDFNYQVFAKAQTWAGGSRSLFRAFRVVSSGLSVAVVGPDRIAAGGLYTYRATAVLCGGEQRGFKYAWRLPGMPASALEGLDSATLRLDTAQLVWQSEFVLTCVVTSMDTGDVGTGSLRLRPVGGGVRARLPAERRSVSAGQPVFLDGSRSADLDRRPGSLAFTWSCQLADGGGGCFVGKPGALRRLEQHLGQEAVSQPTLRVPADLLGADTWYRFTLRVEKNSDVDEASTEVFVGRQRRPRLWINRNQDFFSPYEPIYIPAQVSTDWRVTVRWETEYELPAAALDSASFQPTDVAGGTRRRPFDLVLPPLEQPGDRCMSLSLCVSVSLYLCL